ncbi:MAG: hypothetical protein M0Z36_03715 [Thermaerobacter sp.]|nr:hypothetical protein [Thermaerobacter sp.]
MPRNSGPPRSKAYTSFQVRLEPELKDKLMQQAYLTGQSQVAIVHEALQQYFLALEQEDLTGVEPDLGNDGKEGS